MANRLTWPSPLGRMEDWVPDWLWPRCSAFPRKRSTTTDWPSP